MRDLRQDFEWLTREKMKKDLADDKVIFKRKDFHDFAPEYEYGITFVESDIAYEWLTRAIEAEEKLEELVRCKDCDLRYQYPQNVFCNRHIGKVHDGFCFEGKRRRDEE